MKKSIIVTVALIVAIFAFGLTTITWTGSSLDRYRAGVVKALAYYTTSDTSDTQTNWGHKGIRITVTTTDTILTPSLVFTLQGYNVSSATWFTVLASAAITGESTTNLFVYPGAAVTTNVSANTALPHFWRIVSAAGDTDSCKYAVIAELIP